jgi:hypothetical protein
LRASGPISIRDVANVATSFPGFVDLARSVGLNIRETEGCCKSHDGTGHDHRRPSGSGKGTISRAAAKKLGWALLDSGALYRLVALAGRRAGISLERRPALAELGPKCGLDASIPLGFSREEVVWLMARR